MRPTPRSLLAATILPVLALGARAEGPRVVRTAPADGDRAVDPGTRELRIEFDRPMARDGYSLVGGPSFPRIVGTPRWLDDRTFATTIRLEPEHDYQLGVNSERFQNFRSVRGEAATPYPLRFRTASAGPDAPADPSRLQREAFEALRRAVLDDYAHRDRTGVDWGAAFREAEDGLIGAATPAAFAERAAALLAPARDPHFWLRVGERIVGTHSTGARANLEFRALKAAVPRLERKSDAVLVGRFDDGIGYILIGTWALERVLELEPAFEALADLEGAKGLVLDLRANGGGHELLARQFAGCFLDAPAVYARQVVRRGGETLPPRDSVVAPNRARPKYRGKVAVLMGPACLSSAELFLLMMDRVPGCTLVGERTSGSSGNPLPVDLGNGVVAFVPSWRTLLLDGSDLEGRGLAPDVEVPTAPGDFAGRDPVIEQALEILRSD